MKKIAVILAGGTGTRAGGDIPKQLQLLEDKPIFAHSIEKFLDVDSHTLIVLVINTAWQEMFVSAVNDMLRKRDFRCLYAAGGSTRAHSVINALHLLSDISDDSLIAIHDAARPLVACDMIERGWQKAYECGTAIPVIPVTDTIRQMNDDGTSTTLRRSALRAVQTPQVFSYPLLREAYAALADPQSVTDDASVVELFGRTVSLYPGSVENIKITSPADFSIAAQLMHRI